MGSIAELLLATFSELIDDNLRIFQFFLYSSDVEGYERIPKARASGLDRVATVELLVQTYGKKGAFTVTVDILKKMNFRQLAQDLEEKCREGAGNQANEAESDDNATRQGMKFTVKEEYHVYKEVDIGETVYRDALYIQHSLTKAACGCLTEEYELTQTKLKSVSTEKNFNDVPKPECHGERLVTFVKKNAPPAKDHDESIC